MIVILDLIGHRQIGGIENPRFAAEELEQTRRLFHHKPRIGPFAQGSVEQQDARRRIEIPQAQGWTPMNIVRLERWKTVGIGKRPQSAVVRLVHARTSARSEEHTSELQSLMRISYAVFCLKKKIAKKSTN